MELRGVSLIGFRDGGPGAGFRASNPATGDLLEPHYSYASDGEVAAAVALAAEAFPIYGSLSGTRKASFLRHIATSLEAQRSAIADRAAAETGLTQARLESELARTAYQLRLFADQVEEGSWVNARLDSPDPARKPAPKPDVRSMLRPLGPVVVFSAGNFPLAFSVAGGDTASALAAGNPVVVKAHLGHPGTSEMVGRLMRESVRACGLPEGTFSVLFGEGEEIGRRLIQHPEIKAVGFTGSAAGGKALSQLAATRPAPIPCYAEMGSVNPVFILPGILEQRAREIAAGLYASFTLGSGQFCTKPGLVFLPQHAGAATFRDELNRLAGESSRQVMLTPAIKKRYADGVAQRIAAQLAIAGSSREAVKTDKTGCSAPVVIFATDAKGLQTDKILSEELFGPSTLLIEYQDRSELLKIASGLEGHLTATVHGSEEELIAFADLVKILETKVGRLLFNGYPTGVEVGHAMIHGGPFPATSDGRSTSVGTQAIFRFTRPICYQNFPESMLPDELKSNNPLNIPRMMDGQMTR